MCYGKGDRCDCATIWRAYLKSHIVCVGWRYLPGLCDEYQSNKYCRQGNIKSIWKQIRSRLNHWCGVGQTNAKQDLFWCPKTTGIPAAYYWSCMRLLFSSSSFYHLRILKADDTSLTAQYSKIKHFFSAGHQIVLLIRIFIGIGILFAVQGTTLASTKIRHFIYGI